MRSLKGDLYGACIYTRNQTQSCSSIQGWEFEKKKQNKSENLIDAHSNGEFAAPGIRREELALERQNNTKLKRLLELFEE